MLNKTPLQFVLLTLDLQFLFKRSIFPFQFVGPFKNNLFLFCKILIFAISLESVYTLIQATCKGVLSHLSQSPINYTKLVPYIWLVGGGEVRGQIFPFRNFKHSKLYIL